MDHEIYSKMTIIGNNSEGILETTRSGETFYWL